MHAIKIDRKGRLKKDQGIASCLTIGGHGCGNHSDMDMIAIYDDYNRHIKTNGIVGCVTTQFGDKSMRHGNKIINVMSDTKTPIPGQDFAIRKLTPRECLRLMGMPEEDINKLIDSGEFSDSALYRLAGNSIVVDNLEYVFAQIFRPQYYPEEASATTKYLPEIKPEEKKPRWTEQLLFADEDWNN